jgi:hypothetical protein
MSWRLYQIRAEPVLVTSTPAAVSVASWSEWWPGPVRKSAIAAALTASGPIFPLPTSILPLWNGWSEPPRQLIGHMTIAALDGAITPPSSGPTPPPSGAYTVSGLYVTDQFTDNTVVYDYSGGVSHRTN